MPKVRISGYLYEPISGLFIIVFLIFLIIAMANSCTPKPAVSYSIELSKDSYSINSYQTTFIPFQGCQANGTSVTREISHQASFTYKSNDRLPLDQQVIESIVGEIYSRLSKEYGMQFGTKQSATLYASGNCSSTRICRVRDTFRRGKVSFTMPSGDKETADFSIPIETTLECESK